MKEEQRQNVEANVFQSPGRITHPPEVEDPGDNQGQGHFHQRHTQTLLPHTSAPEMAWALVLLPLQCEESLACYRSVFSDG